MLLAGDEFRRTQGGNNNAYCQDNETSWLDWTLLEKHREWFRFFKLMIKFRQSHRALGQRQYYWGEKDRYGRREIASQCTRAPRLELSRSFALTLLGFGVDVDIHVMISAYTGPLHFELPEPHDGGCWFRVVDTSLPSLNDIAEGIALRSDL